VSIPYIPIPIFSQPRRQKDAIESNNKTAQCTKQSPTTIKASEGRRFIVTRYTAGVPGIPSLTQGVWRTPIEADKETAKRTRQLSITSKSYKGHRMHRQGIPFRPVNTPHSGSHIN